MEDQKTLGPSLRTIRAAALRLGALPDLEHTLQAAVSILVSDFDSALADVWLHEEATNLLRRWGGAYSDIDPNLKEPYVDEFSATAELKLPRGFFARVRVPGSGKYRALLIPDQAVGTDQGQKFVYVVDDQDTVQSRKVVLGPSIEGLRVVRDGVQSNDWVLVNGIMSVRPGAKVKPNREAAPSEQPATAQK